MKKNKILEITFITNDELEKHHFLSRNGLAKRLRKFRNQGFNVSKTGMSYRIDGYDTMHVLHTFPSIGWEDNILLANLRARYLFQSRSDLAKHLWMNRRDSKIKRLIASYSKHIDNTYRIFGDWFWVEKVNGKTIQELRKSFKEEFISSERFREYYGFSRKTAYMILRKIK